MTSAAKKILEEALALSQQEREELVGALSSSLDPVQLSPEWNDEIGRRIRKIERGEAKFPYSIIACPIEGVVTIVAVAHTSRQPGYWRGRVK